MDELLKEFFYDGIVRVIPGLIAIAFYGRVIATPADFHDAPITLSICAFLAAWLTGATIEILRIIL